MYPGNDRKSKSSHDIREYSWYSRVPLTILMTNINDAFLGWLSISCSLFSSFRWKMISQYSHLITVSGCLILTTVNWLWFGCKRSFNDCWKVWHTRSAYMYSQNDRFHLSPRDGHVIFVRRCPILTAVNSFWYGKRQERTFILSWWRIWLKG